MKQFETNEELIYALIIDDLDGAITPSDKVFLDQWRSAAAENEKTYRDFLSVQLNMDKLYQRDRAGVEESWNALDKKIVQRLQVQQFPQKGRGIRFWLSAAAAVLVLLSLTYYFINDSRYVVVSTANHTAITRVVLPDGTEVNLNAGTTIKYLKHDFVKHRKLELKTGEVFIHVAPNNVSRFSVDLGDVTAEDIGTSFNVVKNDQKVSVIVEEGKVALKHLQLDRSVMLSAGKLGVYDIGTQALAVADNPNVNYKAWLDRKFVFKEISVAEAAEQLEKAYQVPVNVKDESLKSRKLTASLHYQTLDSALAVISASLQCKVTKEKNMYVLSEH
ncbi:transmembrane sensor [Pedobacter africanus]|uniref:Ferric-dicitrate binding protein FerR (Iron transport regulator) n=1 Tax=Pedobacter africanus TaxID=151894 RepID=A0ACC6L2I5_9SPHI|nr:FecR domain-containing protein [Pedobacter africanus]MDR6785863.1 ferric-dicitrate binding protein FerR (iron transport regulator) [Pedobacter africanus]